MSNNVLITGGSGYLGSKVALKLLNLGFNVSLILRPTSSLDRLGSYAKEFNIIKPHSYIDIQNLAKIIHPEVIIHTACCYGRNGENALQISDTNYRFGVQLICKAFSPLRP